MTTHDGRGYVPTTMRGTRDEVVKPGRGVRLGKYQLRRRLGEGAFSEVWEAKDVVEERWVALKLPAPVELGSAAEADLLGEIRIGGSLVHDNILRVRNADRVGTRYLIATDLAKESLDQRLTRRLATRRALDYLRQLLEGMAYAHSQRVIHRDLKPSNLMLFADGTLRIADFGLAKVAKHTMISATGSGTLLYVAPEQAHGYPCFASDVFAIGLIGHQMLTGSLPRWPFRWPFEGSALLRQKVGVELTELIRQACHPDHRQRLRDAGEVLAAFRQLEAHAHRLLGRRVRARAARKLRTRRALVARRPPRKRLRVVGRRGPGAR